jgi:hypothetical protein
MKKHKTKVIVSIVLVVLASIVIWYIQSYSPIGNDYTIKYHLPVYTDRRDGKLFVGTEPGLYDLEITDDTNDNSLGRYRYAVDSNDNILIYKEYKYIIRNEYELIDKIPLSLYRGMQEQIRKSSSK